jgi:CubicO group peptidase (beta-lactamase class C family)
VTPASIYDLASLTKVVGTTSAVMLLVQEGRLGLDDPVVRHLPDFARGDSRKADVTIRHLLVHRGGFPPFRTFYLERSGADAFRQAVYDLPLDAPPGAATVYSDIGFKTLAWVVEAITQESLASFLDRRLFAPLGMTDTGFIPDPAERGRIAPTEKDTEWRPYHILGEVHDENAHAMGGVAGHAGLFSTAQDLAVFVQLLANGGMLLPCVHETGAGVPCGGRSVPIQTRFFQESIVETFTRRENPEVSRALGWDTPSGRSSAGDYFSAHSFGHTGFTGTSIWVDPELELAVVLLTNRVNPSRDNSLHIPLRRDVHDGAARAITDRTVQPREP